MIQTKLIRQLSLLALLLNRKFPVNWQAIRSNIPEYGGKENISEKSFVRKFERDKKDLRDMGIPIETITSVDDFGNEYTGYVLKGDSYSLPELKLTKTERTTLNHAAQAILSLEEFPLRSFALSAQRKLIFDLIPEEEHNEHILFHWSEQKKTVKKYLAKLHDAIFRQKRITIVYYTIARDSTEKRMVDPYGLMFRQGIWYLVGHDHLREEQRVFRVERIKSLLANARKPGSPDYEIPEDFTMKQYMGRESWRLMEGEPVEVKVRFDADISPLILRCYQKKNGVVRDEDGGCTVTFLTTQLDALVRHIIGFKERAEIISPDSARTYIRDILLKMKKVYH